jgi:preprotein translocase subunit SecD
MLQIALWKRFIIWVLCVGGLLLALPNAFYSRVETFNDAKLLNENSEKWSSFLPSSLVNLGLDLRGGAHLLAEVQVSDVYEQRMAALWPDIRDIL